MLYVAFSHSFAANTGTCQFPTGIFFMFTAFNSTDKRVGIFTFLGSMPTSKTVTYAISTGNLIFHFILANYGVNCFTAARIKFNSIHSALVVYIEYYFVAFFQLYRILRLCR